jgi:predicted NBD/HSP70 family sugar kinase
MSIATRAPYSTSVASAGAILGLIRSGTSTSRADVARQTGLSASTVATRIDELLEHGYLREAGPGMSRGGRRPAMLEVAPGPGVVTTLDLGSHHASFGLFDMAGRLLAESHRGMDIADGPSAILSWALAEMRALIKDNSPAHAELRGIAVGVPGPVDSVTGLLVSPSRMPGWNGADVGALLGELSGVPVVVDNDANLMALGEQLLAPGNPDNLVFLKAGSSIGCGVIISGAVHHGHRGMAGDISHVTVPDAPPTVCSCGRISCLDAVAGGAAIVSALKEAGVEVSDTQDILALANDAHPLATRLLREAGARVGVVLATIVNFFDPQVLVIGGHLCQADAFVAGVRSSIYSNCLPMATDQLEITVSMTGRVGGVSGAARVVLDQLFAADVVDGAIRARADGETQPALPASRKVS